MIKFDLTLRTRLFEGRTKSGIGRHAAGNGKFIEAAFLPVSYTHLDVYKRQPLHFLHI